MRSLLIWLKKQTVILSNYHVFIGKSKGVILSDEEECELLYILENDIQDVNEFSHLFIILVYANIDNKEIINAISEDWEEINDEKIEVKILTNDKKHINKNFIDMIDARTKGEVIYNLPMIAYDKNNIKHLKEVIDLLKGIVLKKRFKKTYSIESQT